MKEVVKVNSLKQFIDVADLNLDSDIHRKRFSSKIAISPTEEKTVVASITTTTMDADGDVIMPSGADLKRFVKNAVVLFSHDYSSKPIAKIIAMSVNEDEIVAKMQFADTQEANDCWSLVKGGFLNACSIGFIIKDYVVNGTEEFKAYVKANKLKVDQTCKRIITGFELIENSFCSIPCNPDALVSAISAKSITLSDKTIKELDLPKVIVVEKEAPIVEEVAVPVVEEVIKKEEPMVKSPACRQKDETKEDCVSRKIAEIMGEGMSQEQATAMAYSMCSKSCEEKTEDFKQLIKEAKEEPKRYIKVLRNGGVDIDKLVELKKLALKGRIV